MTSIEVEREVRNVGRVGVVEEEVRQREWSSIEWMVGVKGEFFSDREMNEMLEDGRCVVTLKIRNTYECIREMEDRMGDGMGRN